MAGTVMQSPACPLQTQEACVRGWLAHRHRAPALNGQGASGWRLLVQSSKHLPFARKKDQTPLTMAGGVPWAGTSQSTAGTWVCCFGSSSSSDLTVAECSGAALALPAQRAMVPPAEPTYLQVVEGETTFSTLLSPVLAAELVEQAKAVQTGSLQCVYCLEQLKDGEVSGRSAERKWGPVRGRMETCILPAGERIPASDLAHGDLPQPPTWPQTCSILNPSPIPTSGGEGLWRFAA